MRLKPYRCPECDQLCSSVVMTVEGRQRLKVQSVIFEDDCMTVERESVTYLSVGDGKPIKIGTNGYLVMCENRHKWYAEDVPLIADDPVIVTAFTEGQPA